MDSRKNFSIQKSLLILFFTIIIFFSGIYIGKLGDAAKMNSLNDFYDDLKIETLSTEIEFQLMENSICETNDFSIISDRLNDLSIKLNYMENNLGFDDERVIRLKKYYSILEMKHWLLANKQIKQCGIATTINNSIILYFYANGNNCDDCDRQGTVLSYVKENYPDMKIYSFDINLDLPSITALRKIYNVSDVTPSLIINNQYHEGYLDATDFKEFIENQN